MLLVTRTAKKVDMSIEAMSPTRRAVREKARDLSVTFSMFRIRVCEYRSKEEIAGLIFHCIVPSPESFFRAPSSPGAAFEQRVDIEPAGVSAGDADLLALVFEALRGDFVRKETDLVRVAGRYESPEVEVFGVD